MFVCIIREKFLKRSINYPSHLVSEILVIRHLIISKKTCLL